MPRKHQKSPKAAGERSSRGLLERPSGLIARLSVYVPPDLALSARLRAAADRRTVSAVVTDALAQHLGAA